MTSYQVFKYEGKPGALAQWIALSAPNAFVQADTIDEAVEKFQPTKLGRYMLMGTGERPEVVIVTAQIEKVLG